MPFFIASSPVHNRFQTCTSRPHAVALVSTRDPPIFSIRVLHLLMDCVAVAQLIFSGTSTEASFWSTHQCFFQETSPCNLSLLTSSHPMDRHFVVCLMSTFDLLLMLHRLGCAPCVCFVSSSITCLALSSQCMTFTDLHSQLVIKKSVAKEEANVCWKSVRALCLARSHLLARFVSLNLFLACLLARSRACSFQWIKQLLRIFGPK